VRPVDEDLPQPWEAAAQLRVEPGPGSLPAVGAKSRGLLLLALGVIACLATVPAGIASARPVRLTPGKAKPGKRRRAPSCTVFSNQVASLELGPLKGPGVTTLPGDHSLCSWSGQEVGQYAFVVTVAVFPAPSFLGKSLMGVAKASEVKAARKPGGDGGLLTANPRRGFFFESMVYWSEEEPDKETGKCPGGEEGEGPLQTAVQPGQSGPQCAGQPGTEGNFAEAYGSPKPNYEPMIIQINVASQINKLGPLPLARILRTAYAGRF
jgi:hypothetical protein